MECAGNLLLDGRKQGRIPWKTAYTGCDNGSDDSELSLAVVKNIKETKICLEETRLKNLHIL